ncbi:MAG: hypothetical protein DMF50_06555 [Acidobacteria bacterium]|nr:MAG: hypothetical protein DMF50_06555 [Acidobacteriota bacterium]
MPSSQPFRSLKIWAAGPDCTDPAGSGRAAARMVRSVPSLKRMTTSVNGSWSVSEPEALRSMKRTIWFGGVMEAMPSPMKAAPVTSPAIGFIRNSVPCLRSRVIVSFLIARFETL